MQNGPRMPSKIKENLKKNRLGTKPTKHIENVLILEPSDLQETCFRMEGLQKITKTRGADKYENIPKHSVEMMHKSIKNRSRNSTKNDASKQMPKNQKCDRATPPRTRSASCSVARVCLFRVSDDTCLACSPARSASRAGGVSRLLRRRAALRLL